MAGNNPWNDPNVSPPGLSLPVAIGPMTLPMQNPGRRRRRLIAFGLFMFAGGLLVGLWGHDATFSFIDRSPRLSGWLGRAPSAASGQAGSSPAKVAVPESPANAPLPAPTPTMALPVAPTVAPLEPTPEPPPPATGHVARGQHPRPGARTSAPSKAPVVAAAPAKKEGKEHDPFDLGDSAASPGAARKAKAAPEDPAPAKSPAKSGGSNSLDDLMGGVMGDTKTKGSKDKGIDALLKDVQKSGPAPAAKREEPAAAEPLSPGDISKGMAQVKAKAKSCAQSTGQSGVAELKITVAKTGKVTDATVGGKLSASPLAACIERAAKAAVFRPNTGLTFDYKIDAR